MPDKNDKPTAKEQLVNLLLPFAGKDSGFSALVERLDDKQVKKLMLRIIKDIEDETWASTGAQQVIKANINIKIVGDE